jgi:hypothetical protein
MALLNRDDNTRRQRNSAAILVVLGPYLFLDWLELFGRMYAPEPIGHFACFALPVAKLSILFLPHQLTDYAQGQCGARLYEPALSIAFYMLKIALAVIVILMSLLWLLVIPVQIMPARLRKARARIIDKVRTNMDQQGGIVAALRKLLPTLLGLGLFCVYWYYALDTRPAYFKTDLVGKVKEDVDSLFIFITCALLASCFISLAVYNMSKREGHHVIDTTKP